MVAVRRRRNPLSFQTEQEVRNGESRFEEGRTRPPLLVTVQSSVTLENSPVDCFQRTTLFGAQSATISLLRPKRHTVTFWRFTVPRNETRRSGRVRSPSKRLSPFLTPFTVLNDMRSAHLGFQPRRGEGDFSVCGRRPKALPLDFASWAQLDQLMSAASPPKGSLHGVLFFVQAC